MVKTILELADADLGSRRSRRTQARAEEAEEMLSFDEKEKLVGKFTPEAKAAAESMTPGEARFSVEYYYRMQRERIRLMSQIKMAEKAGEPSQVLRFLAAQSIKFEKRAGQALAMFASNHPVGVWMQSQVGMGRFLPLDFWRTLIFIKPRLSEISCRLPG